MNYDELNEIISQEERKVKSFAASWDVDHCWLVMELVRLLDKITISRLIGLERDSGLVIHGNEHLIKSGMMPALGFFLPLADKGIGFPLSKSTPETQSMAASILHHFGRIATVRRYIDLSKSGQLEMHASGKFVSFRTKSEYSGIELFDVIDTLWLDKAFKNEQISVRQEVISQMKSLVQKWKGEYISYDTSPEIDDEFLILSLRAMEKERKLHGLHPKFRVGGISGSEILLVATLLHSIYVKHLYFCIEWLKKFRCDLANALTIWSVQKDMLRTMVEWPRYMFESIEQNVDHRDLVNLRNINGRRASAILRMFELSSSNIDAYANRADLTLPPLIKVRRNMWIRPLSSLNNGFLGFATKEMRRKHKKDMDGSIKHREAWQRSELYAMFSGDRYMHLQKPLQLFDNNETITDFDAVIVDVMTGDVMLFELKWYEPIGGDERERRARARRMIKDANEWAEKIQKFRNKNGDAEFLRQLGFANKLRHHIRNLYQVLVTMHGSRFSGYRFEHPTLICASLQQIARARLEIGPVNETFPTLYARLKNDAEKRISSSGAITFSVAGIDFEADQFVMYDRETSEEPLISENWDAGYM